MTDQFLFVIYEAMQTPTLLDQVPVGEIPNVVGQNPVFLLVNPTEYHGPHLTLANDQIISRGLSDLLFARLQKEGLAQSYIMSPGLAAGLDPTPGPGTISMHVPTFEKLLNKYVQFFSDFGINRVIVMTFHGAPRHNFAIQRFIQKLAAAGIQALNPLNVVLREMLVYNPSEYHEAVAKVPDAKMRDKILHGLPLDFHAGFFETSLVLSLAPEFVRKNYDELPDCPALKIPSWQLAAIQGLRSLGRHDIARELQYGASAIAWLKLDPFPGYTGFPRFASRHAGNFFVKRIIERYTEVCHAVLVHNQKPPEPILGISEILADLPGLGLM